MVRYRESDSFDENDFENSRHTQKDEQVLRREGSNQRPGVSGKTQTGESWVNQKEYREQTDFVGYEPKKAPRSNDRISQEVSAALMSHRSLDATNIGVTVRDGVVTLSGKVPHRKMKRLAEEVAREQPGVQVVRNELHVSKHKGIKRGPGEVTGKDLGIS